jgi:hypothetical protein
MTNTTSFQESAAGPWLYATLVGALTARSGPGAVPVSRFQPPASTAARPTPGTSGPASATSSPSADLACALGNRLRARLAAYGSPEYELTWKSWDMPSGSPICAVRASARRTSASGSTGALTGWPTPNTMEGGQTSRGGDRKDELLMGGLVEPGAVTGWPTPRANDHGGPEVPPHREGSDGLNTVAQTVGWPTPQVHDAQGPKTEAAIAAQRAKGAGVSNLNEVVLLAGWPTPQVALGPNMGTNRGEDHGGYRRRVTPQSVEGLLAGWATPRAEDSESTGMRHSRGVADTLTAQAGQDLTSSTAATGERAVLNPAHSRWLQGYPRAWCRAAILASRKLRPRRRPGACASRGTEMRSAPSSPPSSSSPPRRHALWSALEAAGFL